MSNVIRIESNESVLFEQTEFDIEMFQDLMWKVANLPEAPEKGDESMAWWFLAHNYEEVAEGPFVTGIRINFGKGKSEHTWRDLKGTLQTLKPMMRYPKKHIFCCRDESDGFCELFDCHVEFMEATI